MPRRLLNIASIACLVASVTLMVLWVRSYGDMEEWGGRLPGSFGYLFRSDKGRLTSCGFVGPSDNEGVPNDWHVEAFYGPNGTLLEVKVPPWSKKGFLHGWGFNDTWSSSHWILMVPYWFLVAASGILAMALRSQWSWQFGLRSLFVLTTFLAIVLGMVVWLDRAWIGK